MASGDLASNTPVSWLLASSIEGTFFNLLLAASCLRVELITVGTRETVKPPRTCEDNLEDVAHIPFWDVKVRDITDNDKFSYLKEYFDAINEEKYDHYKHKECITSIEDMGVKMHVLMAKPYQDQFCDQEGVTDDVEDDKAEERLWQKSWSIPSYFLEVKHFGPKTYNQGSARQNDGVVRA